MPALLWLDRRLLAQGTTGLSVAFDLPTQMGFDSDHPMAAGEVGRGLRGTAGQLGAVAGLDLGGDVDLVAEPPPQRQQPVEAGLGQRGQRIHHLLAGADPKRLAARGGRRRGSGRRRRR